MVTEDRVRFRTLFVAPVVWRHFQKNNPDCLLFVKSADKAGRYYMVQDRVEDRGIEDLAGFGHIQDKIM